MFNLRVILAAMFGLVLLFAPDWADARAGGGKSSGSRGSQTFQSTPAKPIERSTTAKPSTPAVQPGSAATPVGGARGGMFGGSPFMTGLLGGLVGAGIAGMIFGNSAWAAEGSGAAGMLGMFLQFAIIAAIAWFAVSMFRRFFGQSRPATASGGFARSMPMDAGFGGSAGALGRDVAPQEGPAVTDEDRQAFGTVLAEIQTAWSEGDVAKLRQLATPEMVSYFAEDTADAASRGERNIVRNPVLLKGDVVESWVEGDRQYATAVMTWSAIDYIERDGKPVSGDPQSPVEATEAWTFMRTGDGRWLLSAIQQI